jgi:hypothetical protein
MHPEVTTTPPATATTPAEPVHAPYIPATQVADHHMDPKATVAPATATPPTTTPAVHPAVPAVPHVSPLQHPHVYPYVHSAAFTQVVPTTSVGHVDGYGAVHVQHTIPTTPVVTHPAVTSPTTAAATYDGKTITIDGHKYTLKLSD